jgi:hypothetical protein
MADLDKSWDSGVECHHGETERNLSSNGKDILEDDESGSCVATGPE